MLTESIHYLKLHGSTTYYCYPQVDSARTVDY